MTKADTDGHLKRPAAHEPTGALHGKQPGVANVHSGGSRPSSATARSGDRQTPKKATPHPTDQRGDLNLRMLRPLLGYLERHFGQQAVNDVAESSGVGAEGMAQEDKWVTLEQFEAVLAKSRGYLRSDDEFEQACSFEMNKHYGPVILVLRMASVRQIFEQMEKTKHLVTRISDFELTRLPRPNAIKMTYRSKRAESRLMCLSRQAQWRGIPVALWGQTPAVINEESCIAWGDSDCTYEMRWQEPFRWRFALAGLLAGGLGSSLLALSAEAAVPIALAALPLLGLSFGLLVAFRRMVRDQRRFAEAGVEEVQGLVHRHVQASDDLLAMHHRQQQWTELLERQVAERTRALELVATRLKNLRAKEQSTLRGLSHDMRNPLTVVLGTASMLAKEVRRSGLPISFAESVEDLEHGVERLNSLISELSEVSSSQVESSGTAFRSESINVDALTTRFRRELNALCLGRDLRISVFRTREAPETILTNSVVFDRIFDNLLTNAAKYTERGSILVEISGTPNHLCAKISDTGRGIAPHLLESAFRGTHPGSEPLIGDSQGIGLSVAVRLIDTLQGRLEVMSKPDVGTTFWVYLPERLRHAESEAHQEPEPFDDVLARVLRIRPANDGPSNEVVRGVR